MSDAPAPARPSASVVLVRDVGTSLELLLVRRNEKIVFHGGAWVFPGGRVDAGDESAEDQAPAARELRTAQRAAAREALEETGLALRPDALVPFAHWTTPVDLPKRFATWFFVARPDPHAEVKIDASEIVDYRWMTPDEALARHRAGDINLPAPTFVTLLDFAAADSAATLIDSMQGREVQRFVPRLVKLDDGRCSLYAEDAGYDALDLDAPGPRHRLMMRGSDWVYVREF